MREHLQKIKIRENIWLKGMYNFGHWLSGQNQISTFLHPFPSPCINVVDIFVQIVQFGCYFN